MLGHAVRDVPSTNWTGSAMAVKVSTTMPALLNVIPRSVSFGTRWAAKEFTETWTPSARA